MARNTDNLPKGEIDGADLRHGGLEGGLGRRADVPYGDAARGYSKIDMADVPKKFIRFSDTPGGFMDGDQKPDGGDESSDEAEPRETNEPGPDRYPNYERLTFDPESGQYVDRFAGGFLPRDGQSKER